MNATILNRDFQHPADGWYQIEPKGEHPNRAAGVVQVIDDEAADSICNRFNEDAAAGKLHHGSELLVDHEHFSDQPDKETRAYGWLQELRNRDDGIYGRIRWSKTGKEAVDGGDYRFFSTEYNPKDLIVIKSAIGNRQSEIPKVRPLRLAGLTLTNMNNNRGQKPITNRSSTGVPPLRFELNPGPENKNTNMNTVALKLGLAADANEELVLAEVTRLLNRVKELLPHEEENKSLRDRLGAIDSEQVHTLFDLHGVKEEKIRNRLKPVLMSLKNREERVAALLDFGFKSDEHRSPDRPAARVLNRGESRQPRSAVLGLNDQMLAQRAEAEIGDYKIRNRCTYAEARNAVRTAKPELFGLEKK
jgi:phage I-like protein